MPKKIVLIGGGFSDGEYTDLDDFAYSQQWSTTPKVGFIPTASGDSDDYIQRFYSAHPTPRFEAAHLELFGRNVDDIATHLRQQDVIYVGSGNTANMLLLWRLTASTSPCARLMSKGLSSSALAPAQRAGSSPVSLTPSAHYSHYPKPSGFCKDVSARISAPNQAGKNCSMLRYGMDAWAPDSGSTMAQLLYSSKES